MSALTDTSPMPFGKAHLGKPMSEVPAKYLHWCYAVANLPDSNSEPTKKTKKTSVNTADRYKERSITKRN